MSDNGFQEDFISDHLDPLDGHREAQDFDYDAIDRALGAAVETVPEEQRAEMVAALREVLFVIAEPFTQDPRHIGRRRGGKLAKIIGLRTLGCLWSLSPAYFEGRSLSELAAMLGEHKMNLSRHASDFSRRFGLHNRGQAHAWNFKPQSPEVVADGVDEHGEANVDGTDE